MIVENIKNLVGNTPIYQLKNIVSDDMADVYIKLENMNLTGSVKVRAALYMIEGAIKDGHLKPGMTIVEPTSGNTGIALAYIANLLGYKMVVTMPETMSIERRQIMQAYNAELILTPGQLGMKGAIAKAEKLRDEFGYFIPQQFENCYNAQAHYETTGVEICEDFDQLDVFMAGVGTGGTITGTSKRLKEKFPEIEIIAVEPFESSVLSGNQPSPHRIQGIGAGFVPGVLNVECYDRIIQVKGDDAVAMTKRLFVEEGLFLGISSGAAVVAALEVARELGQGKKILTVAPDGGEKYIQNEVFVYEKK